jgi:hypothetical protein
LGEASKDLASLVPLQAIRVELVLENPFDSDDVGANGARDKIPSVVGDQGSKLFFHDTMLVQIDEDGIWRGALAIRLTPRWPTG